MITKRTLLTMYMSLLDELSELQVRVTALEGKSKKYPGRKPGRPRKKN